MTTSGLDTDNVSRSALRLDGSSCPPVDRIASAPCPITPPKPKGKKSKGRIALRQSIIGINAMQRMSLKFSAKNFVTKWAGGLEKHYEIGEMLGEGAYGNVYTCTHIETGAERAVKVIPKSADEDQNATVMREFNVIKELDHPNILRSYAMFENETHFYLVTDLIRGGELYDQLDKEFTEDEVRTLMKSMLRCMNYCHKQNVVHRDLKPENVMLEVNQDFNKIKVIDFGLAKFFSAEDGTTFTDAAGSSYYMSPQVIEGNYTHKCDIWSCGVIAYVCLGGYAPFSGEDETETAQQILDSEDTGIYFDDPAWDNFSDEALDFIQYLMAYDEKDRPTAELALQHEWFSREKCLSMEEASEKRDSARASIENLKTFHVHDSKLKQCTYSLIASQILLKEEKEQVEQMFRTLDVDGDGKISEQDMKTIYIQNFDVELKDDDLTGIMYEVNLSGSGSITYSEFVIASMLEKGLVSDHNVELAFHMIDTHQTGYLCFENLKELLGVDDDMKDYVNHRIIKPADINGDGKISLNEFKALFADPAPACRRQSIMESRQNSRKSICSRQSTRKSFRASVLLREGLLDDDEFDDSCGRSLLSSGSSSGMGSGASSRLGASEPTFRSLLDIFETNIENNSTTSIENISTNGPKSAVPSLFQQKQVENVAEAQGNEGSVAES